MHDQPNVNPKLASIADNGGPTRTEALLAGSPAFAAANPSACPPLDQRGVTRPAGQACDLGAFQAVKTGAPTTAETDAAQSVSQSQADLTGKINLAGEPGGFHFTWGTSPALGNSTAELGAGAVSSDTPETQTLFNLSPGTTYYYAIVADNASGSKTGSVQQFTTPVAQPAISNVNVTSVDDTTATIDFTVDPQGSDTSYVVQYGPDTSYGSTTPQGNAPASGGAQQKEVVLHDLTPGSTYHFNVHAANSGGSADSGDEQFDTVQQIAGFAGNPVLLNDSGLTFYGCPSAPTIDWGDGNSDQHPQVTCTEQGDGTGYQISATHTYATAGHYHVTITESDTLSDEAYAQISTASGPAVIGNTAPPAITGIAQPGNRSELLERVVDEPADQLGLPVEAGRRADRRSGQRRLHGPARRCRARVDLQRHGQRPDRLGPGHERRSHAERRSRHGARAAEHPQARRRHVHRHGQPGWPADDGALRIRARFRGTARPRTRASTTPTRRPTSRSARAQSDVPVNAPASGLVPNAVYHVRLVATNSAGTTDGPDQTFTTPKDSAPPAPVLGGSENVTPSGLVFVVINGKLVPLTEARQLPAGTVIDALHGSVTLIAATGKKGKIYTGTFGGAVFKIAQTRGGADKGLTTLSILEGAFTGAPSYASCTAKGSSIRSAAHIALSARVLQTLRARATGRFRTRGRYASGTVRGTQWTTSDRCDGTQVAVQVHAVLVHDFVRGINVLVHAGHSYLAKSKH